MSQQESLLVVSAHAADFVWRAGGAVALAAARSDQVTVLCLSYGERGESASAWRAGKTLEEIKAQRRDEATSAAAATCTPSSTALCLNNRFKVTAHFDAGGGNSGTANVVQLTPDTGYLWFFSGTNVEAVVKVLNGCGLNSHYWVFAGGLTNVNVVLTVTDTMTSVVRTYTNPANTKFQPIQDTGAFATCP